MSERNKIFIASDLHLGAPDRARSLIRERHFVRWLEHIRDEAAELILLGDVFDFWFEYRRAVPRGFIRLQGKLAELSDAGVRITWFVGNHDLWMKDYFKEEIGAVLRYAPELRKLHGSQYFLGHGDGLGPGDRGYKVLRKLFTHRGAQWAFHRLHPNFGIGLAHYFSRRSRKKTGLKDAIDYGEKELLLQFARQKLKDRPEIDYFVFGHRHKPKVVPLSDGKTYFNTGDWIRHFTYLEVGPEGPVMYAFPLDTGTPEPFRPDQP